MLNKISDSDSDSDSCSTSLSKTKTLKGSKVMAKNHSNKRIDQMHENQEISHNWLQYIT